MSACKSEEQAVLLQAAQIEIFVDLDLISGAPQMHQSMHLVDKGNRLTSRSFQAEFAPFTLEPP